MKAFILAETEAQSRALCRGARVFADDVEVISPGQPYEGLPADVVWQIDYPADGMAEDITETVIELFKAEVPDRVLVEPTRRNKLIIGRVAAALGTSVIPDVIEFTDDGAVVHLVYGGLAHCREKALGPTAIFLVNTSAFEKSDDTGSPELRQLDFRAPKHAIKRLNMSDNERSSVDLGVAERVVGIGRGVAKEEDIAPIRVLAEKLSAELGCTRPIAEGEKWLPRETYIGVSGAMLSPDIYCAIGVSGQVQHTVGINRAKKIIAINKDKSAPIFKQADLGIVGDLYKVVPALTEILS
ncbi:MAG TPA: electron transfer flavoprotein subunit alpha [Coriobacteriia bacterium]|nr:electron transfer flavoprotein subunit alpha [Coriobacteriia bacterium]